MVKLIQVGGMKIGRGRLKKKKKNGRRSSEKGHVNNGSSTKSDFK